MRVAKQQCENCPARSRRVRFYEVEGRGKTLCIDCAKAAVRLGIEIKQK